MKIIISILIIITLNACSSEEAASTAFNSFKLNCDRHSFTFEQKNEGKKLTYISTCIRKE